MSARQLPQLGQRIGDAACETRQVGHGVAVGIQPEHDLAVIADDRDPDGVIREDRDERKDVRVGGPPRITRRGRARKMGEGAV